MQQRPNHSRELNRSNKWPPPNVWKLNGNENDHDCWRRISDWKWPKVSFQTGYFPPCWSPPAARWWPRVCALPRAKVLKFPDWCLALGISWRLVKGWWGEIWWAQKLELSLLKSWQNAYWNLATLLQQINRNQQFINDLSHARLRGASNSTSIKLNFCKVKTAQRYLGFFRGAPNLQAFHIASPSGTGDAPTPKRPVPNRQQDNQIFKASAFRELQSLPNHPTPHNPPKKKKRLCHFRRCQVGDLRSLRQRMFSFPRIVWWKRTEKPFTIGHGYPTNHSSVYKGSLVFQPIWPISCKMTAFSTIQEVIRSGEFPEQQPFHNYDAQLHSSIKQKRSNQGSGGVKICLHNLGAVAGDSVIHHVRDDPPKKIIPA